MQAILDGGALGAVEDDVEAVVVVGADEVVDLLNDGGEGLSLARHEVEEEEGAQDAIALRDVAAEAEAATLLAADEGVGLQHEGCDVLEADGGLVDGDAVALAEAEHHVAGGQGLDEGATEAADLQQVVGEEGEDLEGGDVLAGAVDGADAVGIAVHGDADEGAGAEDGIAEGCEVAVDGLRVVHAGEGGIDLAADLGEGGGAAGEEGGEVAGAGAVHGVDGDVAADGAEGVEVDEAGDVGHVLGRGVNVGDEAGVPGRLEREAADLAGLLHALDLGLDLGEDLGVRATAGGAAVLEAVPLGGVVAGGDHDAAGGTVVDEVIADDGRGGGGGAADDGDAVAGEDLDDGVGELGGEEAGVVADDDGGSGEPLLLVVVGDALGAEADVAEGELLRDDGAPAVRAEPEADIDGGHASPPGNLWMLRGCHMGLRHRDGSAFGAGSPRVGMLTEVGRQLPPGHSIRFDSFRWKSGKRVRYKRGHFRYDSFFRCECVL